MVLQRSSVGLVRRIVLTAALTLTTSFGVFAALPTSAAQSVPYKVNFQGRLTDNNGNILPDGSYNIKFRLFDAPADGTNKYQEDRVFAASDNRVVVQNGLFNIQFGDVTAITPALFSGGFPLYLEVELPTPASSTCASNGCAVFTEGAMTPRQPLASSPYALNADTIDGIDSSSLAQLNTSNTGNLTVTGALQSATASFTGATALTLGSTTNAATIVFNDGTANARAVTLSSPALTGSYALELPTTAPNTNECLISGSTTASQLRFGSCSGATVSLQSAYAASNNPEISIGALPTSGLTVRDNTLAIVGNILEVQNSLGTITYFGVTNAGISVTGTATASVAFTSPVVDAPTASSLSIGSSSATSVVIGRAGVGASIPGGITTSNGTINSGSGSISTTGAINGGAITGTSIAAGAGNVTGSTGSFSVSLLAALHDIATAGQLNIGTSTATSVSIGKSGVGVTASGGIATTNAAINAGTGTVTGGIGTYSTSILSALHDIASAGTLNIGTSNATAISLGKSGVTTTTNGNISVVATTPPTSDQVSISNVGQPSTTSGANGLNITYVGGAIPASGESSGARIDVTPGSTNPSTWNGLRIISTAGASAGVNFNGIKIEGPSAPGGGTETGINITTGWDIGLNIQSGGIQMAAITDPATPSASNLAVYARTIAGRTMLKSESSSGVSYALQPSLFQQNIWIGQPGSANNTAQFQSQGAPGTYTNIPTFSTAGSQTLGYNAIFSTATQANTANGFMQSTSSYYRGSVNNGNSGFFTMSRVAFPGTLANYTNLALGSRFWCGMTTQTAIATMGASDAPTGDFAGFRLSGSAAETTFHFLTRNNATTTNQDTGVTLAVGDSYDLYMFVKNYDSANPTQNNTIYWRIDDLTSGAAPVEGSQTLTLPTATTAMRYMTTLNTLTGAKQLSIQRMYVETDR